MIMQHAVWHWSAQAFYSTFSELKWILFTQGFDGGSKQMLTGTIVHEIFQKAAMAMDFSEEKLNKLAENSLLNPDYLGQM